MEDERRRFDDGEEIRKAILLIPRIDQKLTDHIEFSKRKDEEHDERFEKVEKRHEDVETFTNDLRRALKWGSATVPIAATGIWFFTKEKIKLFFGAKP